MEENIFSRTMNLIGQENVQSLSKKKVIVFGVGGVGGYVCEALARAGIGTITLVDSDVVNITNINRQIIALYSTIGQKKVDVMRQRILDINPQASVKAICKFVLPENINEFDLKQYNFVIDAIDTVTAKIALAEACERLQVKLISCMGTGNKLKPEAFEIADIYSTSVCPLAKIMRKELRLRGVKQLTVLYSKEDPIKNNERTPASISFTPSIAGLRIAQYVILQLINN